MNVIHFTIIFLRFLLLFLLGDFVWHAITGTHNYVVVLLCCLFVDMYFMKGETNKNKK